MKRFIGQLLITLITFAAVNSYSAVLKVTPDSVDVSSNQPVTVSIVVADVVDLYGAAFDITFDPDLLRVIDVVEGDFLKGGTSFLKQIDNQQGRIVIGLSKLGTVTGVSGSGTLISMTLKAKSSGIATIKIKEVLLKNAQLNIIPTTVLDGLVKINLSPVILQVTPAVTDVLSNQAFTVTVTAKDAIDLYGVAFDVIFDADKLRVIETNEGGFLKQATGATSFLNKIENDQGRVIIGVSRLGQVSGVTGSGSLVTITMKAKSSGTTTLRLTNIILQDSAFDTLPASSTLATISILPAILRIEPALINIPTNQNLTVRVMVDKVAGLYGASFDMLFDPALLRGIDVPEGSFLNQDGGRTSFLRTIDNKNGKVIIGISRLEKIGGISGSGTLCSLNFKTAAFGTTTLSFDNLCLKDAELDDVSVSIAGGVVGVIPIKLKFNPQIQEMKLDRECEVGIVAEGVNNLFGAGFDMVFNPDIVEVATITEGNFLNQDGKPTEFMKKVDNGRVVIGLTRLGQVYGVSGSGVLCRVIFKAKAEGTISLLFENITLKDPDFKILGVDSVIGTIIVVNLKAGPISGRVTKADGISPIKDANVELAEMNKKIAVTVTQANGEYEFNNLQAGNYELKVSVPEYNIQLTRQVSLAPGEVETNINLSLPGKIIVYPNPSKGKETVFFQGIPAKSRIKIYSIAGELIRTIENGNSWDTEGVASGVYLYVITDDAGLKEVGKIGVIK